MKKKIVCRAVIFAVFAFLVSPIQAAPPVLLTDIQYWLAPDHIQTIISFNQFVEPGYHHRSNPARFVLEIPNCEDIRGDQTMFVNDLLLQRIRVQRLGNGTTQVVFDLTKKVEASVYTLQAFNGQPDRVVVNLFDSIRAVPLQSQAAETPPILPQIRHNKEYTVVLDPGHGGRDPGAIGRNGLKEKDVVLDLALRLKTLLEKQSAHIKVYLTRDKDVFLPLPRRTEIAEEYNADLFISLHVNADPSRQARGFSVYTLSENATDEAAQLLAEKENAADLLFGEGDVMMLSNDALLTFILADLSQTAWLQHSLHFGQLTVNTTMENLREYKIYKEGLRRANFVVLRTAAMPAVLVEACYMTNKREESLLGEQRFRALMAQSLTKSIIDYFSQIRDSARPEVAKLRQEFSSLAPQYQVHVVKSGESLSLIAGKYKVDPSELRQVNKLASADMIYVGQRLWIP